MANQLLTNLTTFVDRVKNNIQQKKTFEMYINNPPKPNFNVVVDRENVLSRINHYLNVNKYDHCFFSVDVSHLNYERFDRFMIKSFEDGYSCSMVIDMYKNHSDPYIKLCMVVRSNNDKHNKYIFDKFYNYMIDNKLVVDNYGDDLNKHKITEREFTELPINEKQKMKDLCNVFEENDIQKKRGLLSRIYKHVQNKEDAQKIYDHGLLINIANMLQEEKEGLLIPSLMILNKLFETINIDIINNDYSNLLAFIEDNVRKIHTLYDNTQNVYFKNAIMYSGNILSLFH